jgi:hypothetical protein
LTSDQAAGGSNPSGRASESDPGSLDGVPGFFRFNTCAGSAKHTRVP